MNISARKLQALFKKDFTDYFKNPALVVCSLIPLLFVVLYRFINIPNLQGELDDFLLSLGMVVNSSMCALIIPATSIAEEKEKFTLRTLILSNVSAIEFFLAKILVTTVIVMLGNVLIFFVSGSPVKALPVYILCSFMGNVCAVMLSAVIGIMSRDQASSSALQVPVMLLFVLPPVFASAGKVLELLSEVTPYGAMLRLYYGLSEGGIPAEKMIFAAGVITTWILASLLIFASLYKQKGTDN